MSCKVTSNRLDDKTKKDNVQPLRRYILNLLKREITDEAEHCLTYVNPLAEFQVNGLTSWQVNK